MNSDRQNVGSAKAEMRNEKTQTSDDRVVVPFASRPRPSPPIQDEANPDPPSAA